MSQSSQKSDESVISRASRKSLPPSGALNPSHLPSLQVLSSQHIVLFQSMSKRALAGSPTGMHAAWIPKFLKRIPSPQVLEWESAPFRQNHARDCRVARANSGLRSWGGRCHAHPVSTGGHQRVSSHKTMCNHVTVALWTRVRSWQWRRSNSAWDLPNQFFLLVHGQGDVQDGALFLSIACMNHSWCPNVNHICQWDLQKTLVFASRDVVAIVGDELLPTYGPPSQWLNTEGGHAN